MVAPGYEAHGGNVPRRDSAEYQAWVRAIERLLPAAPADVLDIGTGTGFVAVNAAAMGHRVIGLDLSAEMLAEARKEAERRALNASFILGDAVRPPLPEESLDAIICRHFIWTLREPDLAFRNWLRLLRPGGRVIAIDGFWFSASDADVEKEPDVFKQHYTQEVRAAIPAMGWARVDPLVDLLAQAGFSDASVSDLADVHALAEAPPSAQPWYVVVAYWPVK